MWYSNNRISLYSSAINHVRDLNDSWDDTADKAARTFEDLKYTVKTHIITSIVIGVIVTGLLILCCYLRYKHQRSAKVMTKEKYDEMKEKRAERKRKNRENRRRRRAKRRELLKRVEDQEEDGANLASGSMETKTTILSDPQTEYHDIERDGIEMKLELDDDVEDPLDSPLKGEVFCESPKRKPGGLSVLGRNKNEI